VTDSLSLNTEQAAAVSSPSPLVVVRAGAGTGKTRALVARARRALEKGERRVILLTFTNKAAGEMAARLGTDTYRCTVTTVHGMAMRVLREGVGWKYSSGVNARFGVASPQAVDRAGKDLAVLHRANLLTYKEILRTGLMVLEEVPSLRPNAFVLVDEAQDLTPEQWRFVRLLGDRRFVVGDVAQSVFGWNGADLREFRSEWDTAAPEARFQLVRNYRSVPEIVDLANRIPTPGRVGLVAQRPSAPLGGPLPRLVEEGQDPLFILHWLEDHDAKHSDVAILSRTRARLGGVAAALDDAGIPYRAPVLAGKLWDSDEGQVVLSAMHVAANPHDSLHLRHLLQVAGWDDLALARAEHGRTRGACSLWGWIVNLTHDQAAETPSPQLPALLFHEIRPSGAAAWHASSSILHALLGWDLSAYESPLRSVRLWTEQALSGTDTPEYWLRWYADPHRVEPELPDDSPAVHLSTIHAAKGLEWPHVIVWGCEEGHLPHARSKTPEALEEERRLFYVAVTRARETVTLCRSSEIRRWAKARPEAADPSRFLKEVGV